ncbi:MAG: YlxR family protein [Thermodesulfobacteriota bacterium]
MPERTCIGCRKVLRKERLVRLVVDGHGCLAVGRRGAMDGRGGYLCPRRSCLDAALRKGRGFLARVFKRNVEIMDGERLWKDVIEAIGDSSPSEGECNVRSTP